MKSTREVGANVNEGTFNAPTTHKIQTHVRLADKEPKAHNEEDERQSSGHPPLSPPATRTWAVDARTRLSEGVSCHPSKPHYKRLSSDCPTQPLLAGTASTIHSDPGLSLASTAMSTTGTASSSSDRPTQPLFTGTANTIHSDPGPLIAADAVSEKPPTASSSSEPNLKALFKDSLDAYEDKTKESLRKHPLTAELQTCSTPDDTLARLRTQLEKFKKSTFDDIKWTKWLKPIVHVLYRFSEIGTNVGLVNLIYMILLRSIL